VCVTLTTHCAPSHPCAQVRPKLDMRNPSRYLQAVQMRRQLAEERSSLARAEREALELAECTFRPQTTPLPAYLLRPHMYAQAAQQGAGYSDQYYAEQQQWEEQGGEGYDGMAGPEDEKMVGGQGEYMQSSGMQAMQQQQRSYAHQGGHSEPGAGPHQGQAYQRVVVSEGGLRPMNTDGGRTAYAAAGRGRPAAVREEEYEAAGHVHLPTAAAQAQGQHIADLQAYKVRLAELQSKLMQDMR
jgi:hypothetical protein